MIVTVISWMVIFLILTGVGFALSKLIKKMFKFPGSCNLAYLKKAELRGDRIEDGFRPKTDMSSSPTRIMENRFLMKSLRYLD